MCSTPSLQQPNEFQLAKRREKRETQAARASAIRQAQGGVNLLKAPTFPMRKRSSDKAY